MKYILRNILILTAIGLFMSSCQEYWDDHYSDPEPTVNTSLLEALRENPRYSSFVSILEATKMDTIFGNGKLYTLFIPSNDAFDDLADSIQLTKQMLSYLITPNVFIIQNVKSQRNLQMLIGKYALLENRNDQYTFDGIPILYSSPQYLDGKFYELSEVALNRLSLYEYIAAYSATMKAYIDSKDSVFFDLSLSTPIGIDESGNTLYDSVFSVINTFEQRYFEISEEFRDKSATMLLFTQEQYEQALTEMATNIGGSFVDYNDIPLQWQNEVFLPLFISKSMFPGNLVYSDLEKGRLQGITGDSVDIDLINIDPDSRNICSNGITFLYSNLSIPDSLYTSEAIIEGEDLLVSVGANNWSWNEDVTVTGTSVAPTITTSSNASNNELLVVDLGQNYKGTFTMEFEIKNLFPVRYRLEWRATSRPAGNFAVYANDVLLGYASKWGTVITEFDLSTMKSDQYSVTKKYIRPVNGYNIRDYYIDNHTEFGSIKLRFEYLGSGSTTANGFNLDYIKLIQE